MLGKHCLVHVCIPKPRTVQAPDNKGAEMESERDAQRKRFIHPINRCLLSIFHVPGTILGPGVKQGTKRKKKSLPEGAYILVMAGRKQNKQILSIRM